IPGLAGTSCTSQLPAGVAVVPEICADYPAGEPGLQVKKPPPRREIRERLCYRRPPPHAWTGRAAVASITIWRQAAVARGFPLNDSSHEHPGDPECGFSLRELRASSAPP